MNNRKYFRELNSPFIAAIIEQETVKASMADILNSEHDGAEGFMVNVSYLSDEDRTVENLRQIFNATSRPVMPLVYRVGALSPDRKTDEELVKEIWKCVDAGATSIDIMGDLFDRDPVKQISHSEDAVKRQKELIEQLHNKGVEVLVSSHASVEMTGEEALKHMQNQKERGADITKLVSYCNSEDSLVESIRTLVLLKKKMDVPFIFVGKGCYGRLQRYFAPVLGSMLNFAVSKYSPLSMWEQPTINGARMVLDEMTWHQLNKELP